MLVPAFALPKRERSIAAASFAPVMGALAASALGTLVAVLTAVLSSWAQAGDDVSFGIAVVSTAAAPALAMVLYGLAAKAAVRVIAGGIAAAPAIAVYYLFQRGGVDDTLLALLLALAAGLGASLAYRAEKKARLYAWWGLAAGAVAVLWIIGNTLAPADVWIELPF